MLECPSCESKCVKRNGHIYNGKQNYRCLECGRQFVENPSKKMIDKDTRRKVLEAVQSNESPEAICERYSVSMSWLVKFMAEISGSG